MKKSALRIICFLTLLSLVINYTANVLKFKDGDGIYTLTKFYELEDNSVDVLVLGSSHAFESFNTGTLWNEHGMSSYVLGGSIQPMWNSYYYLKEALKTQTPSIIILEGYMLQNSQEYSDTSRIIKNNYGLKWSMDKIEAIQVSSPEEHHKQFLLDYTQYHTRYSELSQKDFLPNQGNPLFKNLKGFGCNMATKAFDKPDISTISNALPLGEKTETYYRKTIELAQSHNIPILVVITPYPGITTDHQAKFNTGALIANEYNVPFINYNLMYDEIDLDFQTDCADTDHLNYKGNIKFTQSIGSYLKEHYTLEDHRNDSRYQSWQANADYISAMIENQRLLETTDTTSVLDKLNNPNYQLLISVDGTCTLEDAKPYLNILNLPISTTGHMWHIDNSKKNALLWNSSVSSSYYASIHANDLYMEEVADTANANSTINIVMINNTHYNKVANGINITVYDSMTQKVIDSIGLDMNNGYHVVR